MRTTHFQRILSVLTLLGAVSGSIDPATECKAQAWVRAPDLVPNTIIQGDARVKLSAGCPLVQAASLGLRFKERSFLKALRERENTHRLQPSYYRMTPVDMSNPSPWASLARFDNRTARHEYEDILSNKDLWFLREEERIAFETTLELEMTGERARNVIQDFAILVPSTNFPPALDYMNSGFITGREGEMVSIESMYEYFVRVEFANGTTTEISAGFTGFHPLYNPSSTSGISSSETVSLKRNAVRRQLERLPITNYTAQIIANPRLEFSEALTMVITRTGPARVFGEPLVVSVCVRPTFTSKWVTELDHGTPSSTVHYMHTPEYVLRSTLADVENAKRNSWTPSCLGPTTETPIVMPNATSEQVQGGDIVTTTSVAIPIPVKIQPRRLTDFETYYQTLANSVDIRLKILRAPGETVDLDDPSRIEANPSMPAAVEEDEKEWVPWKEEPSRSFTDMWTGTVPVAVVPTTKIPSTKPDFVPGFSAQEQVIMQADETQGKPLVPVHYLSEGARAPIFVDGSALQELLNQDPAEREVLAPLLEPRVASPPEGEELMYRYYRRGSPTAHTRSIYVGETWARHVANKPECTTGGP